MRLAATVIVLSVVLRLDFFATSQARPADIALMFRVPSTDSRLRNKDEVLGFLLPTAGGARQAISLSAKFLLAHPVYSAAFEGQPFVILTTPDGANRLYEAGPHRFVSWEGDSRVIAAEGRRWRVAEEALIDDATGTRLPRRTAFRAFWFGWHAQFLDTILIK